MLTITFDDMGDWWPEPVVLDLRNRTEVSPPEAALLLNTSVQSLYKYTRTGELKNARPNSRDGSITAQSILELLRYREVVMRNNAAAHQAMLAGMRKDPK